MPIRIASTLFLALMAPAAAQAQPAASPERLEVVLSNFAFAPSTIRLHQGRPYRLHFVNEGSGGHNFAAKPFFAAARIEGAAPAEGVVELKKGESRDVTLVPAAGHYKVKCTHFLHAGFGMKGEIVVE